MRRFIMTNCLIAAATTLASLADARPIAFQVEHGLPMARAADRAASTQAGLMRRWTAVGKCVVGRDRETSKMLVRAPLGSYEAMEAARRLDPVFAGCLAGSGVPGPSSAVLRRAALADALGITRLSV